MRIGLKTIGLEIFAIVELAGGSDALHSTKTLRDNWTLHPTSWSVHDLAGPQSHPRGQEVLDPGG